MPRIAALTLSFLIVLTYLAQLAVPELNNLAFVAAEFSRAPWTILTSTFLHSPGDYMHLLNNLFFLALFGYMLEQVIGTRRFLAVYVTAGITANLAAFTFYPNTPVLGASGAISGVVAALAVVRPRMIGLLWGVPAPMWAVLLGWIGLNTLGFGAGSTIAFEAHLYGLITGVIAGAVLRRTGATGHQHRPRPSDQADLDIDIETWEKRYMRDTERS